MAKNFHPRDFFHPAAHALRLITDWIDTRYDPVWNDSYDFERVAYGNRRVRNYGKVRPVSPASERDIAHTRETRARRSHLK